LDKCTASVTKALEIDPNDHEAHRIMGAISMEKGNFELARHHHERAKQLCPSDAYIMGKNAALLVYLGDPEKALETVHWAMRINPFCPDDLYIDEGMCHYWLKDYKEAINCFKKIKTQNRDSLFYLAASLAKADRENESTEALHLAIQTTDMNVENFVNTQRYQNPDYNRELLEVLESIPC